MSSEGHRQLALSALSRVRDVVDDPGLAAPDPAAELRAQAVSALTNALLAIHAELRRSNEQRDRWAEQVVRVLSEAKNGTGMPE